MSVTVTVLCSSALCMSEAEHRVYWPGHTVDLCEPCRDRAIAVADAMGFGISAVPISMLEEVR